VLRLGDGDDLTTVGAGAGGGGGLGFVVAGSRSELDRPVAAVPVGAGLLIGLVTGLRAVFRGGALAALVCA
jgi:hypothetical protein